MWILLFNTKKWEVQASIRLPFSEPMTWHHQPYHKDSDCYFCQTNVLGHSFKSRKNINYANVATVTKPVPLCDKFTTGYNAAVEAGDNLEDDLVFKCKSLPNEPHLVSRADFGNLVRDLRLTKRASETLGSRLKQWNWVDKSFQITSCRKRDRIVLLEECFEIDSDFNDLVYCVDIPKLFSGLNHNYNADEWRLFIDGSSKSMYLLTNFCFPYFKFMLFI